MNEETIYSDNNVSISTSRITAGGTTYALRNVSSVKMTTTPAKKGCAVALIIVGLIWGFAIIGSKGGALGAIVLGGACVAGGILWLRAAKDDYHVAITSNAGEVKAFTSKDRSYIEKLVAAVNEAMVRYK
ncbi:MAG: DUF6232 family protein [Chthoniobacterales bacterium]